ncbi:MAG: hypothetical protein V3R94_08110 [Acidobacteriota bacterium]
MEAEAIPPARQNSILRTHFRKQFAAMRSLHNSPSWRNDPFIEDFIDRQIDHYLVELQDKLAGLRAYLDQVQVSRTALLELASGEDRRSAVRQWENSLKQVERHSGDIWNQLRYVFTGLEDKDRFKPRFNTNDKESLFQPQMQYLEEEVAEAEKEIQLYFFEASRTIAVEDIKGENMLIHLYHVRQMAKKLKGEKC